MNGTFAFIVTLLSLGFPALGTNTQALSANASPPSADSLSASSETPPAEVPPPQTMSTVKKSSPMPFEKPSLRRKPTTVEDQKKRIREAAQMYEKHFLREMVKAMRATTGGAGGILPESPAEKIFREQLDDDYIDKWSDRGGVGYADLIYDQIIQRYGRQMGIPTEESIKMGKLKHGELRKMESMNSTPDSFLQSGR